MMKWYYWIHAACGTLLGITALIVLGLLLDEIRYFPNDREGALFVGFWFCTLSAAAFLNFVNARASKTSRTAAWLTMLNLFSLLIFVSMFIKLFNDTVSALLVTICMIGPFAHLIRVGQLYRSSKR